MEAKRQSPQDDPSSAVSAQQQQQQRLEDVLKLLSKRMEGNVTNAQVETAVSELLTSIRPPSTGQAAQKARALSSGPDIQRDTGNYDDSSSDEEQNSKPSTVAATRKRRRCTAQVQNESNSKETVEDYQESISQIPMGKEAVKMMTTFGDGPKPVKEALESALLGTRRALQITIMDARKVRRRLQKEYKEAQAMTTPKWSKPKKVNPTVAAAAAWASENAEVATEERSDTNTKVPEGQQPLQSANSIDPRLVFRALAEGTDKLSYAHKCGFHMEELTYLYPEEMRAYQRWNEMHEEYTESKADDGGEGEEENKSSKDDNSTHLDNDDDDLDGGHLKERAANFDFRTDKMKEEWYVEYSKVRQGSFLPSGHASRKGRTKTETEWETLRKQKKGRHFAGSWENLNAKAVRFLHWLGFDPPNLFPPDEETTHALAFLAYDRLGRIVEKAIFLRNEQGNRKGNSKSLWELPPGHQLSKEDIDRALEDPDIKPATVYGTEIDPSSFTSTSVQLYFGPGWEDRLELEMEEMVAAAKGGAKKNSTLTNEERMVRDHEVELLTNMSKPPGRDGEHLEKLVRIHKEKKSIATESMGRNTVNDGQKDGIC